MFASGASTKGATSCTGCGLILLLVSPLSSAFLARPLATRAMTARARVAGEANNSPLLLSGSKNLVRSAPTPSGRNLVGGLMMSTIDVDVAEEGGGADAEVTVVNDEFDVKTDLLKQIDLSSSSRKRTQVNELMLKLEPMNPTDAPAKSPVLNGVWEFLYTGGLSPGTLAVQVLSRVAKTFSAVVDLKGITLTIKRDQPRVEAAVKASVLGTQAQVKVRTRLEQMSDMRLQEVYEEAEVAGVKISIPSRIQPRRTLFITYLDEDIMIARDDSGAPDLLIRKEKDFRFNTGKPSASEDDSSPGSG